MNYLNLSRLISNYKKLKMNPRGFGKEEAIDGFLKQVSIYQSVNTGLTPMQQFTCNSFLY